jgi:hypothetical protein
VEATRTAKKTRRKAGASGPSGDAIASQFQAPRAARAGATLDAYQLATGEGGTHDADRIRELEKDLLHWLAQHDYPEPTETLIEVVSSAIADFADGEPDPHNPGLARRDPTVEERVLGSCGPERAQRVADERKQSPGWFYLSFATQDEFLGAAIVRAHGILTAVQRASELGIYPGGEIMCQAILRRNLSRFPRDLRNRLLSPQEVCERLEGEWVPQRSC